MIILDLICRLFVAIVLGLIAIILWFILSDKYKERKGLLHNLSNSMSSFTLDVNRPNVEQQYKNLDMKSFDDIGGLYEVKEELKKYVKCFDNKKEFKEQSVEIPRGILLWGPPGCGKTSLAKAIAYEAHVSFICRNASDLIDKQFSMERAGNNIEELFNDARKIAPCIVFIDELDVIGSRYNSIAAGEHQVEITRLLAEMDGFQNNKGIMIIAATNDKDRLDPALLRSGRFGKKYYVGPPTSKKDILEVVNMYIKGKRLNPEITDDVLATIFNNYSPADIKSVLNECGVTSILNNIEITVEMLRTATLEIHLNSNLGNVSNISPQRRHRAARHEAGHAIVATALGIHTQSVTILGTSNGVRGVTKQSYAFSDIDNTTDDKLAIMKGCSINNFESIDYALRQISVYYGGVAAELVDGISHDQLDIGFIDDLDKASILISNILRYTNYLGDTLINWEAMKIGLGGNICNMLIDSAQDELSRAQNRAISILKENHDILDELSSKLAERITISDKQLDDILINVRPWTQ